MKIPTPHNISYEESMIFKDHLMIYDFRVDPQMSVETKSFKRKLKKYLHKREVDAFYDKHKSHWFLKKFPLLVLLVTLGICVVAFFLLMSLGVENDHALWFSCLLFYIPLLIRIFMAVRPIERNTKQKLTEKLNEIRIFFAYHEFDYRLKPIHDFVEKKIDALGKVIEKFNAKYWDKITFSEQANLIPELGQKVGNYAEHLRKTKTLYEVQWTFYTMVEDGLRDFKDRIFTQQSLYQDTKTGLLEISIAPASFEEDIVRIEKIMHEVMRKPLTVKDIERNTRSFEKHINDFEKIFLSPANDLSSLSSRNDNLLQ